MVQEAINKINKDTKANLDFACNKMDQLKTTYLKTPSYEVNAMLGGGIARGRITELYGDPGSGKTMLAIETLAEAQRNDPDFVAAWLETEGSIDDFTLATFGVDTSRLIFWTQDTNAETALEGVRGLVNNKGIDMLIVNSVAGLSPSAEVEKDLVDANVAAMARLMSKLMRLIVGPVNKNNIAAVFINQLRSTIPQSKYAPQTTTTGGRALAYYSTTRVHMRKAKVDAQSPITEDEGIKIICKVLKNRLAKGNPYTTCEYHALYGIGIQSSFEIADMLVKEGIIRKAGSWLYLDDENGEPRTIAGEVCKFRSRAIFLETLDKNEAFKQILVDTLEEIINTGTVKTTSLSKDEIEVIKQMDEEIENEQTQLNLILNGSED